jgi:hypothetical protein
MKKKNKIKNEMTKIPVNIVIGEILEESNKLEGITNKYNEMYKQYKKNDYLVTTEGTDYIPLKFNGKPIYILSKPEKQNEIYCSYCGTLLETEMGCCIYCGSGKNNLLYNEGIFGKISEEINVVIK